MTLTLRTKNSVTTNATYDPLGRMTQQAGINYTYDGLDRVTTRNAATFTYAGTANDPVTDGAYTYSRGLTGNALTSKPTAGTARNILNDAHGDVIANFDATGTINGSSAYNPYGEITNQQGTNPTIGYQGSWTDPTTADIWMAARWYRPATATFLSEDTISGPLTTPVALNRYTYANGNPTNYWDPTGHSAIITPGQAAQVCAASFAADAAVGGYVSSALLDACGQVEHMQGGQDAINNANSRMHSPSGRTPAVPAPAPAMPTVVGLTPAQIRDLNSSNRAAIDEDIAGFKDAGCGAQAKRLGDFVSKSAGGYILDYALGAPVWDCSIQHSSVVFVASTMQDIVDAAGAAIYVPGMGTNISNAISAVGDLMNVVRKANSSGARTLPILWMGYDPPEDVLGSSGADDTRRGDEGAPRLGRFLRGTSAAARVTLIGHSYGSFVAGKALQDDAVAAKHVDAFVYLGSPGFQNSTHRATDFHIRSTAVFGGDVAGDPVAGRCSSAVPLLSSCEFGDSDPYTSAFGAQILATEGGGCIAFGCHSAYFNSGSKQIRSMTAIVTGFGPVYMQ